MLEHVASAAKDLASGRPRLHYPDMKRSIKPASGKAAGKMVAVKKAPQKPTHASRSEIRRAVKAVAAKFERVHA